MGQGGFHFDILDAAVHVHIQITAGIARAHNARVVGIHQRYVSAGLDMLLEHIVITGIVHHAGFGNQHITLTALTQVGQIALDRIHEAAVHAHIVVGEEGRQDRQALMLAVQVPLLTGAQVLHQAVVVLLHDDAHIARAAGHERREHKVNHAITRAHGQSGRAAKGRQLAQGIRRGGINQTHHIVHCCRLLYSAARCSPG